MYNFIIAKIFLKFFSPGSTSIHADQDPGRLYKCSSASAILNNSGTVLPNLK